MKNRAYFLLVAFSLFLLLSVLVVHFRIRWLPLAALLLGAIVRRAFPSRHLEVFTFLIPLLPALARLENRGFPLNYLLLPLLLLCGVALGEVMAGKKERLAPWPALPRFYLPFLCLVAVSFLFVILRWSNLTLSRLAFLQDTPVAPGGQRLSFGIIFPIVELALFTLSPLYYLLLRRLADPRPILVAFLSGHSVSIAYSLFRRLTDPTPYHSPVSGMASDATVFGFLSALALLLSWYLYVRFAARRLGLLFFFVSLLGILNSATRIGIFAVVLSIFLFIFSARRKIVSLLLTALLMAAALFSYIHFFYEPGNNFLTRLRHDLRMIDRSAGSEAPGLPPLGDLSVERKVLWGYGVEIARRFPLTGVGVGNFVFWAMHAHYPDFFHHLPASQYFFLISSVGLPGLLLFLLFFYGVFVAKPWPERSLLAAFLFFFIFNDYLWFSQAFLAFWLVCSLGEKGEGEAVVPGAAAKLLIAAGLALVILSHAWNVPALHPQSWALEAATPYDYGLYQEESEHGRAFRWTGAKAGIYLYLDDNGRAEDIGFFCGAPLKRLRDKTQTLDVYWRGKFLERLSFRRNGHRFLHLTDPVHREGFLELRVRPIFNLERMGLGEETRELGVQLHIDHEKKN